jgi:hypothetical protein
MPRPCIYTLFPIHHSQSTSLSTLCNLYTWESVVKYIKTNLTFSIMWTRYIVKKKQQCVRKCKITVYNLFEIYCNKFWLFNNGNDTLPCKYRHQKLHLFFNLRSVRGVHILLFLAYCFVLSTCLWGCPFDKISLTPKCSSADTHKQKLSEGWNKNCLRNVGLMLEIKL